MENTPQIYREYESDLEYTDLEEKKKSEEKIKFQVQVDELLSKSEESVLDEGLASVP